MILLWTITIIPPAYILVAYGMVFLLNFDVPNWAERTIVIVFGIPLQILVAPWFYLLGQFGLMKGEWIRAPDFLGVLLVAMLYGLAIHLICRLFLLLVNYFR